MSKKGRTRQALKIREQKINSELNQLYYQNGSNWKHPADANTASAMAAAYKKIY